MKTISALFRQWAAIAALVVTARATVTPAADYTASGNFNMEFVSGVVGEDLAIMLGHENGWTATLRNASEIHDSWSDDYARYETTYVSFESFTIAFSGPDADLLNQVVGGPLMAGGNAWFIQRCEIPWDRNDDPWYWGQFGLSAPEAGLSFGARGNPAFCAPLSTGVTLYGASTGLGDHRPGNDGSLSSYPDVVSIQPAQTSTPSPPKGKKPRKK